MKARWELLEDIGVETQAQLERERLDIVARYHVRIWDPSFQCYRDEWLHSLEPVQRVFDDQEAVH